MALTHHILTIILLQLLLVISLSKQPHQVYQPFTKYEIDPQRYPVQFHTPIQEQTVKIDSVTVEQNESKQEKQKEYNQTFNEYLSYGLMIGFAMLAITLVKHCQRVRTIRNIQNHPIQMHNNSIDDEISFYEQKLKQLKSKKAQYQLQQIQAAKKNQQLREQQIIRNQQYQNYINQHQLYYQNDFNNQLYQQNNIRQPFTLPSFQIPFGRPIQHVPINQDNNSSFASDYPSL